MAAASALKTALFNDTVTVPEDPVTKVPMMLAEASDTHSKPPAASATGAKANFQYPNVI